MNNDNIKFNALGIDYDNIQEYIDGTIYLNLKVIKETDRKELEKILKKIRKYQYNNDYDIKVDIEFIKKGSGVNE